MGHFLRILATRAADDSGYVAWAFRVYAESEGITSDSLFQRLGVSGDRRPALEVCVRPTGEAFAAGVGAIANRFSLDLPSLATILRQVEVLAAMSAGGPLVADGGAILAARMRSGPSTLEESGTSAADRDDQVIDAQGRNDSDEG